MKIFFKWAFYIVSLISFIFIVIVSIAGGIVFYQASNAFITLKQGYNPIEIYDDKNNLISTDSCYYSYVSINDISPNIINSFIAIEDKDFRNHQGFNTKRIISSLFTNLTQNTSKGASTITQQYVKNAFLNNEKTISRKV